MKKTIKYRYRACGYVIESRRKPPSLVATELETKFSFINTHTVDANKTVQNRIDKEIKVIILTYGTARSLGNFSSIFAVRSKNFCVDIFPSPFCK